MKEIELKNCPNCKKRIGIHDIECPFCKYIDDPKYKKHNSKLNKKTNTKKNNKDDIYKIILIMPILMYLASFMLDINKYLVLSLLLLNKSKLSFCSINFLIPDSISVLHV